MAMYPQDAGFVAIEEIHEAALRNLPRDVADFLETGAETQATLRANRDAFTRWVIRPRPMSGVSAPQTSTEVLGIALSVPVLTAPFGGDGLFGAEGHLAVARANARCGMASIVRPDGRSHHPRCLRAHPFIEYFRTGGGVSPGLLDSSAVGFGRGYGALYSEHITQANEGCDFGFLARRGAYPDPDPQ
jgi:isopentenyl diphosphate isomerase/L-lactate dehydrogenase-like FMN-dependent dehydrogenase